MNKYEKHELRRHVWLYNNDCLETLDIVCPGAFNKILISRAIFKVTNTSWENYEIMLQDMYRKDMYPRIKAPSLWKRIKWWCKNER